MPHDSSPLIQEDLGKPTWLKGIATQGKMFSMHARKTSWLIRWTKSRGFLTVVTKEMKRYELFSVLVLVLQAKKKQDYISLQCNKTTNTISEIPVLQPLSLFNGVLTISSLILRRSEVAGSLIPLPFPASLRVMSLI